MGKNNNWKKFRKEGTRELAGNCIYIFTEGNKTEPNYFKSFKKLIEYDPVYRNKININIVPCQKGTARLVETARNFIKENKIQKGDIWLVYDRDEFVDFDEVPKLATKYSTKEIKFHTAWSNQCFELWYILHFDNYQTDNPRSEYQKFLNRKLEKFNLGTYEKNREDMFEILLNKGNPKKAISFAKNKIEKNKNLKPSEIAPGTTVYTLVEELAKYIPYNIRSLFI